MVAKQTKTQMKEDKKDPEIPAPPKEEIQPTPPPKKPAEAPRTAADAKVNMEELSNLSGESTVKQVKYVVPVLKFNGNKGDFTILRPDGSGNYIPEPRGKAVEGVVIKIRRTFTAFEKIPGGSIRYFTNEHNSFKDQLTLFERGKDDKKPKMIDEGSIKKMREAYPNLRLRQNLYFLYEDEVVKLGVRGKSLSSLFDYYKEFGPKEHLFQYVTEITCHEEQSEGGLDYFVMDFKRGKESDLPVVAEHIKDVADRLALQDKAYQEMPVTEEAKAPIAAGDIPVIEEEAEVEVSQETPPQQSSVNGEPDELKVEDIPL